jgi:hypothetical protein
MAGLVQVDVFAFEAERLSLAQAQRERQRPPGAVAVPGGDLQQLLDLWDVAAAAGGPLPPPSPRRRG